MTAKTAKFSGLGLIFDIERFSTRDGPGIRTVIFFKGCNMHCYWCHNPEGIHSDIKLEYDALKCIGCMECIKTCKNNAIVFQKGKLEINRHACKQCFSCIDACYSGSLQCIGKKISVDEALVEVLEDRVFYQHSGGGVTLSGGEVMLQSEFAAHLLKKCKKEGIHTAIDTNMSVKWVCYEQVLPYTDLVIADLKSMDDKAHRAAVGKSNRHVLENIQRVNNRGIPFIVRTPIIPGFNDTEENIHITAQFLKPFKSLYYYELLSYNPLGESKALKIGMADRPRIKAASKEKMLRLAEAALKANIKVVVDGHAK